MNDRTLGQTFSKGLLFRSDRTTSHSLVSLVSVQSSVIVLESQLGVWAFVFIHKNILPCHQTPNTQYVVITPLSIDYVAGEKQMSMRKEETIVDVFS